jgi:alpha-tubulin suppressor-like RCC1 family protein
MSWRAPLLLAISAGSAVWHCGIAGGLEVVVVVAGAAIVVVVVVVAGAEVVVVVVAGGFRAGFAFGANGTALLDSPRACARHGYQADMGGVPKSESWTRMVPLARVPTRSAAGVFGEAICPPLSRDTAAPRTTISKPAVRDLDQCTAPVHSSGEHLSERGRIFMKSPPKARPYHPPGPRWRDHESRQLRSQPVSRVWKLFAKPRRPGIAVAMAGAMALSASLAAPSLAGASAGVAGAPLAGLRPSARLEAQPAATAPLLETWGDNSAGELGDAMLTPSLTAVSAITAAAGTASVVALSAGGRHDLALLSNGRVLAWGDDTYGQLGNGSGSSNDDAEVPTIVKGLSGVVAVAAGGEHSLALLSNGTVEAWGANDDGQLGDGTTRHSDVPVPVPDLTGVTAISAGDQFSLALLANGTVEAWGDNSFGQLGIGSLKDSDEPVAVSSLSGVTEVSAGGQQALALLSDGTAVSWGDNETDQLGDGQDVSTQSNSTVPVAVSGLTGAVAVAAGSEHSLALLQDGDVMAWGDNGFFQLAQPQGFPGGFADSDVPLEVPGISDARAIAAGGLFSLALLGNGTVTGWGDNAFGQLGDSSIETQQSVVSVTGLTGATVVAAGGVSGLALVSAPAGTPPEKPQASGVPSSPWRVVPSQHPSGREPVDQDLNAVSAASATDAWAVGSASLVSGKPLAEHWNGLAWTLAQVAAGAQADSSLNGVDDLSPTDAWAVGETDSGTTAGERTLIENWNGTTWVVVPSPDPETGPGTFDELQAVSGTSPDDLWAVGWFSDGVKFIALLLEHWNGTAWTFFAPPTEESIQFGEAVTVVSADDAWVVGDTESGTVSAHFNGKKWIQVATPILSIGSSPQNILSGVTNAGADDLWASGYENNDGANLATPYLLRWTGKAWKLVKVPTGGSEGSRLFGVTAFSASDVWTAGATYESDGGELALTEQFNGTSWSMVPSLDPGQLASLPDNTFSSIAAEGSSTLFAVGSQEIPARCCTLTLAERTKNG